MTDRNPPASVTPDAAGDVLIERDFDAPRELVWKAWTEHERLVQWWGPKGFVMRAATLELRPGGTFLYSMRSPEGYEMWGRFVFREIKPPEKLVFVVSFSDEHGGITRHPLSATWPLEVLNTVTFAEHDGKTTLTLQAMPLDAGESERETFEGGRGSMEEGFTGTFDQLAGYLARQEHGR